MFPNKAGLGSAPKDAASADVRHPICQGITQALSVFIDTFAILLGSVYVPGTEGIDGVALTQPSLVSHLGERAQYELTPAFLLFAFSSIIYSCYLGENALTFMTENKLSVHIRRAIVVLVAVAPSATAVFLCSDPIMGIPAVVKLLALMILFPTCKRLIVAFREQLKAGVERPVFDPDKFAGLDIERGAWTERDPNAD